MNVGFERVISQPPSPSAYPAKTSISPRSSPLGTFCAESQTFLRAKRPQWRRARRSGCVHRLPQAELLDEYKQLRGFNLALPPNSYFFLQNIYTSGGTENNDTDINPPFKFLAEGTAEVGNHSTGPPKL